MAEVCREKLHEKNMNTVVINIMDEVNVHIQEVELTDRRKLVNSVKYFLPHARYSPAFKLGRWDQCRICVNYTSIFGVVLNGKWKDPFYIVCNML
jgi:hypothetical protein